ncbi:MAG TPA: nuclear transport factor 2 family protein [Steroidobacteraceae bacterium]|nr:nuclear transport factor 2 family protein [Steroidobacteraceae bacterium]
MNPVSDIEKLLAIEEIKQLKARRDRAVDLKEWDIYRDLHAPDHQSINDGYPPWTRDDMVNHLRYDIGHVDIQHLSHTPDITIESQTTASGIWYLEDYHFWKQGEEDHWLHGFGFYHERYEKRDGRWLFTQRRIQRLRVMASRGAVHPAKTAAIASGDFKGEV